MPDRPPTPSWPIIALAFLLLAGSLWAYVSYVHRLADAEQWPLRSPPFAP